MSDKILCTIEQLKEYLKSRVSEKRFIHSLGVSQTTSEILDHYNLDNPRFGGFRAGEFCGMAHDLARELSDEEIVDYCKQHSIKLDEEELESPVLAHGIVSADIAETICGKYPPNWKLAIEIHTTGDSDMDDIAMALFCADYIEPSRKFMTQERRNMYLSEKSLSGCAYRILCDMISHWKEKGYHDASGKSLAMKEYLENRLKQEN